MTTTRIQVPDHLCEYLKAKFGNFSDEPIRLPDDLDLYQILYDLLEKRPADHPVDYGNLEIILPERRIGKRPDSYNYLSQRSRRIIIRKIEVMMWAEVHTLLDDKKHQEGMDYKDAVHLFICRYSIEGLTEDAFLKNYYRWREKIRRRVKKRQYLGK